MVGKEGMRSDLFCPVDSEALRRVSGEETSEDAARLCADIVAKDERVVQYLLVHHVRVFCGSRVEKKFGGITGSRQTIVEWRKSGEHLVQQHAQGPPVDRLVWNSINK